MEPTIPLTPVLLGRVLGNHRLINELGSGGMGKVYYAEHVVIGRRAAIKVLNPEIARDQNSLARFINEARAVNEIRHPNVVEITDIGADGDLHYIVMQFLEGETLRERLDRERVLDEASTLRITRQVTAALGAAHVHGIVHRDLKPDNIFLTGQPDLPDFVKVLDFGIAKLKGSAGEGGAVTKPGTVLGTPGYMSPEQCKGLAEVDSRSDIYSLAVVLYQALTGVLPFVSESPMEVMIAHVTVPPVPPSQHNPKLSPHVDAALMRALEKDPARRFATMADLWVALEGVALPEEWEVAEEESDRERPPGAAQSARPRPVPPPLPRRTAPWPGPSRSAAGAMGSRSTAGAGRAAVSGSAAAAPAPSPSPTWAEQQAGARGVADRLTAIIDARLQNDRLLVPTMPAIAVECLKVIQDSRQTFKSVGEVIAKDAVLTSRVLKLANSAAFPGRSPASSLESAISRLGIEGLTAVLVQYSVHQAFTSRDERIRQNFRGIWEHSLGVALIAKLLASRLAPDGPEPSGAYLSGLLHDVGKPVVAALLLEAEKQINQGRRRAWIDEAIWRQIVNESHRKVGVLLARTWSLPAEAVSTIEDCKAYDQSQPRCCANVVRLANALAKRAGLYVGEASAAEVDLVIDAGERIVGLGAEVTSCILSDIHAKVATLMDPGSSRRA